MGKGAGRDAPPIKGGPVCLPYFGTVRGRRLAGETDVFEAALIVEKPAVAYARAHLRTEGLADDRYLCFFGLHALMPAIFACLAAAMEARQGESAEIELTNAQEALRQRERYLVFVVDGARYDAGIPAGLLRTQLALALHSPAAADVRRLFAELDRPDETGRKIPSDPLA